MLIFERHMLTSIDHGAGYDKLFKVLLIGDSGVGKSSILANYVDGGEIDASVGVTIGVDFKIKTCKYSANGAEEIMKLQIWDTAGQERFRAITTSYYRGAHGIVVVYSLDKPDTVKSLESIWIPEIDRNASAKAKIILIGNKSDLVDTYPDQVAETRDLARQLAENHKHRIVGHLETSARNSDGIENTFSRLVENLMSEPLAQAKKEVTIPRGERIHPCQC